MLDDAHESDTETVRRWLEDAFARGAPEGKTAVGLAAACGVSKQAVTGWRKTGRITKSNLARAVEFFGHGPTFGATPITAHHDRPDAIREILRHAPDHERHALLESIRLQLLRARERFTRPEFDSYWNDLDELDKPRPKTPPT